MTEEQPLCEAIDAENRRGGSPLLSTLTGIAVPSGFAVTEIDEKD